MIAQVLRETWCFCKPCRHQCQLIVHWRRPQWICVCIYVFQWNCLLFDCCLTYVPSSLIIGDFMFFFNFYLLFILICLPFSFSLCVIFLLHFESDLNFSPSGHHRWFRVISTNDPYNCTEDQWHQYCFFYWHRVRFIVILWVTVLCVWLFIYFRLYCPEHYPSTCQVRIISQTFPNNLLIVKMLWVSSSDK